MAGVAGAGVAAAGGYKTAVVWVDWRSMAPSAALPLRQSPGRTSDFSQEGKATSGTANWPSAHSNVKRCQARVTGPDWPVGQKCVGDAHKCCHFDRETIWGVWASVTSGWQRH